jgi:HSP20 family protein
MLEQRDLDDEVRRILGWLETEGLAVSGPTEYVPSMDVFETADTVEIVADLPGIPAASLRVVFSRGLLVIAGQKVPARCEHEDATFHLAERSFGRFVRFVRLTGAFDAGRALATVEDGELHVVLARIEERRGRPVRIPIGTK